MLLLGFSTFALITQTALRDAASRQPISLRKLIQWYRGLGLTPFVAMMETLGVDSSTGSSFVQGNTEFCFIMQNFEKWFSTLAIH